MTEMGSKGTINKMGAVITGKNKFIIFLFIVFGTTAALAETKTAHVDEGFSFKYEKCWAVGNQEETLDVDDPSDPISIGPTSDCPSAERGTWGMEIDFNDPAMGIPMYWKAEKITGDALHPKAFEETRVIDGRPFVIYEEIYKESDPFIDRKDQNNFFWVAMVECGKVVKFVYVDHIERAARERARHIHEMPPRFKRLIESFHCDGK